MASPAILLLENEEPFHGLAMGHEGVAFGTMCVSALAAGFPDLLTDPSYEGKIVDFTYPHVGNAGVVPDELQGDRVAARAVVAREFSKFAGNRLGVETLDEFLKRHLVPAAEGMDTRTIAQIAMKRGSVRAVLGCGAFADLGGLEKELARPTPDWVAPVAGTERPCDWKEGAPASPRRKVVVYDFGAKRGFLRRLAGLGCAVRLVPAGYPAARTLEEKPDGVVFSAGPGVPDGRPGALPAARDLVGRLPVWGVGLGAGIVAAAMGARTVVNGRSHIGVQPVGRPGGPSGEMTAQCHDFWIEAESLAGADLEVTHFHLNDGSVEGFKSDARRVMGVLFHPEAEPGPRDSLYLFDRFQEMMNA